MLFDIFKRDIGKSPRPRVCDNLYSCQHPSWCQTKAARTVAGPNCFHTTYQSSLFITDCINRVLVQAQQSVTHIARVWINRVRLPILHVVSSTGKIIFPCPRSRLRIWSCETGSEVPSLVSLLISILRLNLAFTYGIPTEFRGGVHLFILNRHTPSGQSRVYRVTQLRTDGVHCLESAGTEPVNLKVVPNEYSLCRSPWTN